MPQLRSLRLLVPWPGMPQRGVCRNTRCPPAAASQSTPVTGGPEGDESSVLLSWGLARLRQRGHLPWPLGPHRSHTCCQILISGLLLSELSPTLGETQRRRPVPIFGGPSPARDSGGVAGAVSSQPMCTEGVQGQRHRAESITQYSCPVSWRPPREFAGAVCVSTRTVRQKLP